MKFRAVVASDAPLIARHRYPDSFDPELLEAYSSWLMTAIDGGAYVGWLAEFEGRVLAGAGLVLLEWGPTKQSASPYRGRVVNVFTERAWRRRGLARLLVTRCLEEARERGVSQVGLSASEAARSLYEQLGFRPATAEMSLEYALDGEA